MKKKDFEKAIEALGVNGLEILEFSQDSKDNVRAAYARMGEHTYIKWDNFGRGFVFDVEPEPGSDGELIQIEIENLEYLDYRHDPDFDIHFGK